jgi:putative ABC transport system permease protein
MEQVLGRSVARPRFLMTLLLVFSGIALFLAAIGIYGILSYAVAERTNEIGIRMALGADRGAVLRMVVGQAMVLAGTGVALGLVGSFALSRLLTSLLFGVTATDPLTFALVPVLLALVALAASTVPAARAVRVDPMVALRYE